ncbi:MAG TPA: hypothetical protein VF295_07140 [Candidatus Limnocylindria bacterium]
MHLARLPLLGSVLDLAVNFFDERGLLGIALHPDFDSNGYAYLYWTASGEAPATRACSARAPTTSSRCPTWATASTASCGTARRSPGT